MKFVLTAGGTAGHINPAIAVAEELVSRGHQVVFAGTPNRLESKLVPQAGFQFMSFDAKGFNRKKPLSLFSAIFSIIKSTKLAKQWLKNQNVDAVIGFGCYVSLAICRAAKALSIPYVIHEQNSVMGMANNYLSKKANCVCLTYERAKTKNCNNVEITGNPVRKSVFEATKQDGRKLLGIPMKAKLLLVFGGSLGAKQLNNKILKLADALLEKSNLYIVHITGNKQYDDCVSNLNLSDEKKSRYKILAYQDKMGETLAATDLCISRAGASTLAELTAKSLPALLVPYPYATENHQYFNAQTLYEAGCVLCINDDQINTEIFDNTLINFIDDDKKLKDMKNAYSVFDVENAANRICDILEKL